ncbi:MAG: AAA family ATPase [Polyangiaceae bacterium]
MLTRLEVDGFKSLRDFSIDLGPFTVLVGPNSAGKSNILEALALLSRLASEPIESAFKRGRGHAIDQFTLEGGASVRTIRLAAEVLLPTSISVRGRPTNRVRYELTIRREPRPSGTETLVVEQERLSTIDRKHDAWTTAYPALASRARHGPACDIMRQEEEPAADALLAEFRRLRIQGDTESPKAQLLQVPRTHTALAARRQGLTLAVLPAKRGAFPNPQTMIRLAPDTLVVLTLAGVHLLCLDRIQVPDESERIGGASLAPDASNLPTVLADLPARAIGEIRADLVALVPGISTFDVVSDKDHLRIELELSGGDRLPARLVSAGTLRALTLLTALHSTSRPSILAIEEPENGIYPGRLRTLLDLLREATTSVDVSTDGEDSEGGDRIPPQILLTSHSPVVLAAQRRGPWRVQVH